MTSDPNDARPRRARLEYEVRIGLAGRTVEALAKRGIKRHKIPIGEVNVLDLRPVRGRAGRG